MDHDARVKTALAEVHFVQTLLGPHNSAESVLAAEVRRLHGTAERCRSMIKAWREIAAEHRKIAEEWRAHGHAFDIHVVRSELVVETLLVQAKILESIIDPEY